MILQLFLLDAVTKGVFFMQVYKAIKYIRLSYTDDKTVESDSVANQRLEQFVIHDTIY